MSNKPSMTQMYIDDPLYLNGIKDENGVYTITLSNGHKITAQRDVDHNGIIWPWRICDQIFSSDERALEYLKILIAESLTGKRIIYRARGRVPDICGADGCACRAPGEYNRALCGSCPIADERCAALLGLELIYAVGEKEEEL